MNAVQATSSASDVYKSINNAGASAETSSKSANDASQDRFLKLLVTQLKNQDPLNPLDNAQMTSQIAQMSTVSGIEKLNSTLSAFVESSGSAQSLQAAQMIGKSVLFGGSQLDLVGGQAYAGVNLGGSADQVKIKIINSAGQVVQTQDVGARDAGVFNFLWDGGTESGVAAPEGRYSFEVEALRGGEKVSAENLQIGTVSALVKSGSGFLLDLGPLGKINFNSVQQIL